MVLDPEEASPSYGLVRWPLVDTPGLAKPAEKRKVTMRIQGQLPVCLYGDRISAPVCSEDAGVRTIPTWCRGNARATAAVRLDTSSRA